MASLDSQAQLQQLQGHLTQLLQKLPSLEHGKLMQQALESLIAISQENLDRLDWKILLGSLQDMEKAFQVLAPHRHTRKIAVFGSARTAKDDPDYAMAHDFSKTMANQGFMLLTGGGGGIMEAANEGAGRDRSFGLNVSLPFEQSANPFIEGDEKLLTFKYFFTRKLFFLRETDGVAVFPGGFGTMDELFECLTLMQTGKFGPVPLILVDRPGGDYWSDWASYINNQCLKKGLVSPEDHHLYTITDDIAVAEAVISNFYRVYHSSRYVGSDLVMRLNVELSDVEVARLNEQFKDILVSDRIEKTAALPEEQGDETAALPRLKFHYNQRDTGRLYELIAEVNRLGESYLKEVHPEQR
jgi:uncharacterized protein (TIGR00730 family)